MNIIKNFLKLIFFYTILVGINYNVQADIDVFSYYDACRIWLGDKNIKAESPAAIAIQTGSLNGIDTESQWIIKSIHRLSGLKPEKIKKLTDSIDVHYFINYGYGEHTPNAGINIEIMSPGNKSKVNECKGIGAPTLEDIKLKHDILIQKMCKDTKVQNAFKYAEYQLDHNPKYQPQSSSSHNKKQKGCNCIIL